jgi:lambda family phage portal protein
MGLSGSMLPVFTRRGSWRSVSSRAGRRLSARHRKSGFPRAGAILSSNHPGAQARDYDAAAQSRLTGEWNPGSIDINRLNSLRAPFIRARVRDLVRNFPPFARAVNAVVAFTVGKGSRFQSLAVLPNGEPDLVARRRIEDRFRAWMDHADVAGKLHFYELQQLAKRQECESGEFIARLVTPRRRAGASRPLLAVQMHESEQLAAWQYKGQTPGTDIFDGLEYDIRTGEVLAYHFRTTLGLQYMAESWREPAENVLHGFHTLRPGQMRGMTPFAPAVLLARDMGEYTGAEIDAAKLAAKWLAFVTTPTPDQYQAAMGRSPGLIGQKGGTEREDIDWLENAAIEYLREGEKMEFAPNPGRPGDSFDRFTRFILRMVSITMDLPYEILSGDYQNINYSTSKASRNDFSMFLAPHYFRNETHFVRPIFRRWMDLEAVSQDYLPGYWQEPDRYLRAMWIPAGMPSVDPLRDGKADIDAIASGLKSHQEVILGRGHDPEEVVAQRAAWVRLCEEHGVDPTTGGVSTALAHNPAKLGAVEALDVDADKDTGATDA